MESEKATNTSNLITELRKESSISSIQALSSSTYQNTSSNGSSLGQEESLTPKLFPVDFIWKGESDLVYITGSFCNWKQKFLMQQSIKGMFNLTLKLQEGVYQYKYVINDEWHHSPHQPSIKENGITNNIIEVKDTQSTDQHQQQQQQAFIKNDIQSLKHKTREEYDTIKEVNIETPAGKCNDLYQKMINFDNKNKGFNANDYARTESIGHIHLNHLLIKRNKSSNRNVIETGYVRRIRSKYVTLIYITPNKEENK